MESNKLNMGALMRAGGIGLGVSIVFLIISSVASFASTDQLLSSDFMTSGDFTQLGPWFAVSLCIGCLNYIWYAAVGVLYSVFAKRIDGSVSVGMGALGGMIDSVVVALIVGVIGAGIGLIVSADTYSELASEFGDTMPLMMTGLVSSLIGLCIAAVISAALGAAGGAVFAALRGESSQPPAAM